MAYAFLAIVAVLAIVRDRFAGTIVAVALGLAVLDAFRWYRNRRRHKPG
jgi:hypothetical protein